MLRPFVCGLGVLCLLGMCAPYASANAINMTEVKNTLESTSRVQEEVSRAAELPSHVEKKDMGKEREREKEREQPGGEDADLEELTVAKQRKADPVTVAAAVAAGVSAALSTTKKSAAVRVIGNNLWLVGSLAMAAIALASR